MKNASGRIFAAVMCAAVLLCGCKKKNEAPIAENIPEISVSESAVITEISPDTITETETETVTETETEIITETETEETTAETPQMTEPQTEYQETSEPTEAETEKLSVEKDGSYTTPEDVAEYIHAFGTLPKNFITKKEAQALGWDSKAGNLNEVAEGMSIGGDRFGNYEGLLPEKKGRKYTECDVNYSGGRRGAERIIFSNDGLIFYTDDHYKSFTQLY